MLLPAKAGKQPTATASHRGSAKRTEMTCGLRWILSKSKFHKTLLLSLCYVSVAIGWVSLGHEQRPSPAKDTKRLALRGFITSYLIVSEYL
jgi:hypothetical protein